MTRAEFDAVMLYLSLGVGKVTPADQLAVYYDVLGRLDWLDAPTFAEAAKRSLLGLENNFLPAPGVLYRHACDIVLRQRERQEAEARKRRDKTPLNPDVKRLLGGLKLNGMKE